MDKQQLQTLVQSTPLLTETERTFWLGHLPNMNEGQCARLEQILNAPVELPAPIKNLIENFFASLAQKNA